MNEIPYKEILLLMVSTFSAFLLWRIQHQKEKIKNIESQLSDRKYKMYSELIYLIFDITYGNKIGNELSENDVFKKIFNVKRDMFIYAPDEIFNTFTEWVLSVQVDAKGHFKIYFKLMKLIRKDMGHTETQIELDDFMLFLMQNKEEYQKFKEESNW